MRRLPAALIAAAVACGPPPAAEAPSKPGVGRAGPERPTTARARLAAELRAIERPGSVIEGLGPQARADVQKLVGDLSDAERHELSRADGPWPRLRPLLHLAAGGDAADAYYELATSGRAGEELVAARQRAGGASFADLTASTRSVAERAARRWLRDRAADVVSPRLAKVELCDKIDRAALALGSVALRRRARELGAELEPSTLRFAAVANAAAWELDVDAAREALAKARKAAGSEAEISSLPIVERSLASAERARAAQGKQLGVDEAVSVGRALLRLGRNRDALAAVAPHAGKISSHLGIATITVMAKTERIVCPGLPASATSPFLCAVSWSGDARVRDATSVVERAWASRGGRDEEAIGAYLGLAHFVPWIYGTYLAGSSGADPNRAFAERIERVRVALRDAVAVSDVFEGVALFVDTLAALYESGKDRKAGERVRLADAQQNKLRERARALAVKQPSHRFTHAGILAVATALSQESDISPILALLPPALAQDLALPAHVLGLWAAVGERDAKRVEEAAGAIAALLPKDSAAVGNAKLILLIAEARAAVLATPREIDVLSRIAAQLSTSDVPAEVRLRAAIDRAGSLARQGQPAAAETALQSALEQTRVEAGTTEGDLATIAHAYLLVLRARAAKGDERSPFREQLVKLNETGGGQLPASMLAWRDLWLAEIDRLIAEDKCGAMKVCRERAAAKKSALDDAQLAARVGAASAKVMQSGVLAAGSMHLNFAFSAEEGLLPIVVFEPRLLAVELPPRPAGGAR